MNRQLFGQLALLAVGVLWVVGGRLLDVPVLPWELTVRPVTPQARGAAAPEPWLLARVERPLPHLDGLAVGDQVRFDRYGVLAPLAGAALCVPVLARGTVRVVPLGGGLSYAGAVRMSLVDPATPGCAAAGLGPVLPQYP